MIKGRIRRAAERVELLLNRGGGRRPSDRPTVEMVDGLELYVPPSVLNPVMFRTGMVLAHAVRSKIRAHDRILDMGCGSAIVSLLSARAGAEVVAVDVNPQAVRAARINAMLNDASIDVRLGDLFGPVGADERFDLIAFNPPFFGRAQGGVLETALCDAPGLPIFGRFLTQARAHLTEGGALLVAGSTRGALGRMRAMYSHHGYTHVTIASRERISERITVDSLSPSGPLSHS